MRILFTFCLFTLFLSGQANAQMWNGTDTIYGNEWIDFDQDYHKITITEDGIYRISYQTLINANIPVNNIQANQFQIFHLGQEIPLYLSSNATLQSGDYLEFYAEKNRSTLDEYLFTDASTELLNPAYSLFNDEAAYFLSWADVSATPKRYDNLSNNLNNLPAKEEFFWKDLKLVYSNKHTKFINSGIALSDFGQGEGFASNFKAEQNITLAPDHIYTGAAESELKIRLVTSNTPHEITVNLEGQELVNENFNGYRLKQYNADIATSTLSASTSLSINGNYDDNDKTAISLIELTYPSTFNFNNQSFFPFTIAASNTTKYLEIENFNTGSNSPILYDLTNQQRLMTSVVNDVVRIALPAAAAERQLVLVSSTGAQNIASLTPINFIDYNQQDAQFIIISNQNLFDDGQSNNWVEAYKDYRSTPAGGDYNSLVIEVQQLYDQFAFGVNRHPLSIRNFAHFVKKKWSDPRYLFLIGKGREYINIRTAPQLNANVNASFYVPTFGYPGADNLLVSNNESSVPIITTGRIAVSSAKDVKTYLNKVKALEANTDAAQTIEEKAWMKRVIHLGGGDITIQNSIKNDLLIMENIIENNKFGAEVSSFYKTSSDPIQISQTDQIFDIINNGVSMITFFGHSAVGTFDFSIDDPDSYDNYGKYPLMFSLGCYSGNVHTNQVGVSERFLFFEDKGAIAMGASSGLGYASNLKSFASKYYQLIGEEMYGAGIGDVLKATIKAYDSNTSTGFKLLTQQFNIQGDPSIKLNPQEGPDYLIPTNSVSFAPRVLTAGLDSFNINFSITNIGYNLSDSFFVEIQQQYPNNDLALVKRQKVAAPAFTNSFSFKIANRGKESVGQNRFFLRIDADNEIEEAPNPAAEINNELISASGQGIEVYIIGNNVLPVYPYEFSIVNKPDISLQASTGDAMAPAQKYYFEIDTTTAFDSPLRELGTVTEKGGVIKWNPTMNFVDNTVYYWRISLDSMVTQNGFIWENSSFVYLENSSLGWNQSHQYQYEKDEFYDVELNAGGQFKYLDDFLDTRVENRVKKPFFPPRFYFNGSAYTEMFSSSSTPSVNVAVVDPVGKFWKNTSEGAYGSLNTWGVPILSYYFKVDTPEERKNLMDFIDDVIPDDHFVYVYSALWNNNNSLSTEDWALDSVAYGKNLYSVLENQGSNEIRSLETKGTVPFTLIFKKNDGLIQEGVAEDKFGTVDMSFSLPGLWTEGSVKSTYVGPAKSWDSFLWSTSSLDNPNSDTISFNIYGSREGIIDDSLLFSNLTNLETDLSSINPKSFPFLRLEFNSKDVVDRTSAQLNYWRVLYEGVPEAAINPSLAFEVPRDTVQQGEPFNIGIAIENISDYDMDSLLVQFTVIHPDNSEDIFKKRFAPLPKANNINATIDLDTKGFTGNQRIIIEANPDEDQAEKFHFNNFALSNFHVSRDRLNPLLDVTFDGTYIMDGDIVSSKPNILVSLKDENQYLSLSDTSLFKLFLQYPDDIGLKRVYFTQEELLKFYPATSGSDKNKASIELTPLLELDGTYQLIVQAEDATGNQSGELDFKVSFKIVNQKSISNILNYPNPFSTSTKFVYTMTGDKSPDFFKIQIMSVSGKIVKEITQDEMGPLRVGTHMTDYTWDGTDDYGDKLANGVYLYRVVIKETDGQGFEKFNNGTDKFFKNEFGKLVILR
ncbi:MAG: C25 family cysteine peptidase [Saprospiraceae bacterium]